MPIRLRREIGTAGPRAITSPAIPSCSARRPARRSAARLDGASTLTTCPSSRSADAAPATCSLTSCGFDQENGVTRQMRSATDGESSRGSSLPILDEYLSEIVPTDSSVNSLPRTLDAYVSKLKMPGFLSQV